jgi:hypothetical protein
MEVEGEEVQVYDFLKEFDFDLKNVTKKSCYEILLEYCEEKKKAFIYQQHFEHTWDNPWFNVNGTWLCSIFNAI